MQCKIEASIVECFNARLEERKLKEKNFSAWDSFILKNWSSLKVPTFEGDGGLDSLAGHDNMVWSPPENG